MSFDLFGGSKKTSSTTRISDERNAAADNASIFAPRLAVGKKGAAAQANAAGSIAIRGNANAIQYTVNNTDGGAFSLVGEVVKDFTLAAAEANAAALNALTAQQDELASLAETKLTDGANLNSRTTLVAVVAFAVVALAFYWFNRR